MKFFTAIDRDIFRLVLMPMLAVFVIAASLLVLDKMLKLFDFVATQGGPVGVVFRMLASMFPEYASLAKSIIENVMLNGETIRLDGAIRMAAK